MVDIVSPEERSRRMRAVRREHTTAELRVRSAAHRAGFRFRLHRKDLPGSPDLVLPRHRAVVFVHGCFWHRHEGCRKCSTPRTRQQFWLEKFKANVERDRRNEDALIKLGWRVITIWECETNQSDRVLAALEPLTHPQPVAPPRSP